VRVDAVHADTEHADAVRLEVLVVVPKLGKLVSSTRREVEHVEGDHRGPVPLDRLGQSDRRATRRGELEVRCDISYLEHR